MDKKILKERMFQAFPFLNDAGEEFQEEVLQNCMLKELPKDSTIFFEGDECTFIALILSGTARVYKLSETGREITLYRLEKGESCMLTVSSILSQVNYPAIAVTEDKLEAIIISSDTFRDWMNRYEEWRTYIFRLLSKRLASVIGTVEEVAFHRMDLRITEYLLQRIPSEGFPLKKTHQEIAFDLGTSREVVSRILKDFERKGLLLLSRGAVTIKNRKNLKIISENY